MNTDPKYRISIGLSRQFVAGAQLCIPCPAVSLLLPSKLRRRAMPTKHRRGRVGQRNAALKRLVRRPETRRPLKLVAGVVRVSVVRCDALQRNVQLLVAHLAVHVVHATRLERHHVRVPSGKK